MSVLYESVFYVSDCVSVLCEWVFMSILCVCVWVGVLYVYVCFECESMCDVNRQQMIEDED